MMEVLDINDLVLALSGRDQIVQMDEVGSLVRAFVGGPYCKELEVVISGWNPGFGVNLLFLLPLRHLSTTAIH